MNGGQAAFPKCSQLYLPLFGSADAAQDAPATSAPGAPAGGRWSVHKFGGTCVGTPERIANVAAIISEDSSARKFVIVSAMSQVRARRTAGCSAPCWVPLVHQGAWGAGHLGTVFVYCTA